MTATTDRPVNENVALCAKCGHNNDVDSVRCGDCGSHLYVSCKHCGCQNLRSAERCVDCRTQLHQRGRFKWKHAKARKWIQAATYVLLAVGSAISCWGIVKISQIDFSHPASEPIYIQVDSETFERLQSE